MVLEWMLVSFVSLLIGVALTLFVQRLDFVVRWRAERQRIKAVENPPDPGDVLSAPSAEMPQEMLQELTDRFSHPPIPIGLKDKESESTGESTKSDDALLAVNLLAQFMFREMQTNGLVRRFLLRRINREMEKAISAEAGAVTKIIKQLKVCSWPVIAVIHSVGWDAVKVLRRCCLFFFQIYDFSMGSKAPTISRIQVKSVVMDQSKEHVQSLDVSVSLDYSGAATIGIDVLMAYGKTASVTAKSINDSIEFLLVVALFLTTFDPVDRLEGDLLLSFSREPYSHWSVAFQPPPLMEVTVGSRLQGQSYPTITKFLVGIVRFVYILF